MYSRIGRRDIPQTDQSINIPENYSGSAFNGGLFGDLSEKLPENVSATANADMSANVAERVRYDEVENGTDLSETARGRDLNADANDSDLVSCSLPGHMAAGTKEARTLPLDNDQLLILGLILLLNDGTLDEDMLVLLILLLL